MPSASKPTATHQGAKARVVVVEDELAHAELISRAFRSRQDQFELSVVHNITEARRRLDEERYDLVITDLVLPDGRGIDLLGDDSDRPAVPVVVMTSHGDEKVAVEAIKAGALDYVVKSAETLQTMPHVAERTLREWHRMRELEQTQHQLRHAQKMEAIGNLSSGIAHDFNNLLMGITGCSDVALSKLDADDPARRYVEEIKNAALRGSSLTRQLLSFSRKREHAARVVDFDAVVEEANNLLRPLVSEDIEFSLELSDEKLFVHCDPGQIEQMLVNLVVNARDAMPGGGKLRVATRAVTFEADAAPTPGELEAGDYVELSVADTGSGIDEETLEHIFEPFFTTKDVGRGTGLGLSTIYGIVKQCHGEIIVDSEVGRGTIFQVYLPRTDEAPQQRVERPKVSLRGDGETVLVVEDESLVRLTVRGYLERGGYRVLSAKDGTEALAIAEGARAPIDVLVTDMVLPGLKGAEIAREVRSLHPQVHVVFMSAYPPDKLHAEGRLAPEEDSIQKPFGERDLLAEVYRALHKDAPAPFAPATAPASVGQPAKPARSAEQAAKPVAKPAAKQESKQAAQRQTILLVEDHETARWTIRELLEEEGYAVLEAANGASALALVEERADDIDLVISDMKLPDVAGAALASRLRQRRPDLGVIFTSGRSEDDPSVLQALELDGTTFVAKPVDFDTLLGIVEEMLADAPTPADGSRHR